MPCRFTLPGPAFVPLVYLWADPHLSSRVPQAQLSTLWILCTLVSRPLLMCVLVFWKKVSLLGSNTTVLLPSPGFLWLEPGEEAEPDKRLILLRTLVKGTECPNPFTF